MPAHNTTTLDEARRSASASELHHPPTIPPPILDAGQRQEMEDRISGAITDFAGSMRFVYIHTLWFGLWIIVNAGLLLAIGLHIIPFDPFPFGLLTLVVSLEAIYLSTFVMIAQNRQGAVADARARADYAVNVQAEAEIAKLLHLVQALMARQAELAESMRIAMESDADALPAAGWLRSAQVFGLFPPRQEPTGALSDRRSRRAARQLVQNEVEASRIGGSIQIAQSARAACPRLIATFSAEVLDDGAAELLWGHGALAHCR